jgi:hypothetical protein
MLTDEAGILPAVLEDHLLEAMQLLTLDDVVEFHAERRLLVERQEGIEGAARLADADVLQGDPVERQRTPHPLCRPVRDRDCIVRRDDDVDAVQHAGVIDASNRGVQPLLSAIVSLRASCMRDCSKADNEDGRHD